MVSWSSSHLSARQCALPQSYSCDKFPPTAQPGPHGVASIFSRHVAHLKPMGSCEERSACISCVFQRRVHWSTTRGLALTEGARRLQIFNWGDATACSGTRECQRRTNEILTPSMPWFLYCVCDMLSSVSLVVICIRIQNTGITAFAGFNSFQWVSTVVIKGRFSVIFIYWYKLLLCKADTHLHIRKTADMVKYVPFKFDRDGPLASKVI